MVGTSKTESIFEGGSSSSSNLHEAVSGTGTSKQTEERDDCHENASEKKKELLTNPWVPSSNCDFASDAIHLKRKFNHRWLDQYTPWLVYSSRLKGALCLYCVLFPPRIAAVLGSFMVRPYMKFKDVHEDYRKHVGSHYHKSSTAAAKSFLENAPVDVQLQIEHHKTIEENKQILSAIISCIIFCGIHDLSLRGKE